MRGPSAITSATRGHRAGRPFRAQVADGLGRDRPREPLGGVHASVLVAHDHDDLRGRVVPGRRERKLFTHLTHDKPPTLVDTLLRGGFRRSQNIAYMPYCEGCRACVPVRVLCNEFEAGRTMQIGRAHV